MVGLFWIWLPLKFTLHIGLPSQCHALLSLFDISLYTLGHPRAHRAPHWFLQVPPLRGRVARGLARVLCGRLPAFHACFCPALQHWANHAVFLCHGFIICETAVLVVLPIHWLWGIHERIHLSRENSTWHKIKVNYQPRLSHQHLSQVEHTAVSSGRSLRESSTWSQFTEQTLFHRGTLGAFLSYVLRSLERTVCSQKLSQMCDTTPPKEHSWFFFLPAPVFLSYFPGYYI